MKVIKFIFCLLFGLMFINAGLDKFFHYMPMEKPDEAAQKVYAAFMELGWLMPLTGIVELVGGVLFIFPKTRALGAIVILPVMVGIVIHNFVKSPMTPAMFISIVLFLINLWILIDNRKKYEVLVQ
ncbi:DoxX family protein [Chryseobacterium sp. SC28]|uniref:DoxX family protein n=1 Tax=Chryseobacterium sp. SC28 TaxID=2268028 RepID=UPI000F64C61E|nr:DoxX family protein [Chryseobacterium sp. SC28]RRQ47380.1 DoxX family membrane protein [Chryseobacterium sp. SC28]